MWYTKNLTIRETFQTIHDTNFIAGLFEDGLLMNNDRLAVSAMEELLRRGDTDLITERLDRAFSMGWIICDSPLITLASSSLVDNAKEVDSILWHYGKALRTGVFVGPTEWLCHNADKIGKSGQSKKGSKIRRWAAIFLPPAEE